LIVVDDALAADVREALLELRRLLDAQLALRKPLAVKGFLPSFDHSELFVKRKTVKRLLEVFR
jgi:hypothetical protein